MQSGIVAIIPARWASSRFPGKPLALIAGKPMIRWVYERTKMASMVDQVIVATDDQRIFDCVKSFGGNVVMTSHDLSSGTDRVAVVASDLDARIIVNVQGDEPLIEPDAVDLVAKTLQDDEEAMMATLARKVTDPIELDNFNTARIVLDSKQRALYFTRAVVPFARDIKDQKEWPSHYPYYDQIGIYAYRRNFLLDYHKLPFSILEQAEKLEQLRAVENGYKIKVGICNFQPICVDIPQHIELVETRLRESAGYLGE
jgi:3-deoxy-manno-octulosonate cytidylyltransferase (CMP-KDO synthetase)